MREGETESFLSFCTGVQTQVGAGVVYSLVGRLHCLAMVTTITDFQQSTAIGQTLEHLGIFHTPLLGKEQNYIQNGHDSSSFIFPTRVRCGE